MPILTPKLSGLINCTVGWCFFFFLLGELILKKSLWKIIFHKGFMYKTRRALRALTSTKANRKVNYYVYVNLQVHPLYVCLYFQKY